MHEHKGMIPIWFFIGILLLMYGVIILFADLLGAQASVRPVLAELHAGTWWGILLTAAGLFWTIRYLPKRGK